MRGHAQGEFGVAAVHEAVGVLLIRGIQFPQVGELRRVRVWREGVGVQTEDQLHGLLIIKEVGARLLICESCARPRRIGGERIAIEACVVHDGAERAGDVRRGGIGVHIRRDRPILDRAGAVVWRQQVPNIGEDREQGLVGRGRIGGERLAVEFVAVGHLQRAGTVVAQRAECRVGHVPPAERGFQTRERVRIVHPEK